MKDLTSRELNLIRDDITVSKNRLSLPRPQSFSNTQNEALNEIYSLLLKAEAIMHVYFPPEQEVTEE